MLRSDQNADDDHLQGANGLGNGGWGQGHFCADDGFTLYINGQEIVQGHDWQDTQAFTFGGSAGGRNEIGSISCDQDNVYAVEGTNTGGGAGFIGDITHCGREISTQAARWKCSTECPKGWEAQGFDDSAWEIATDFGPNGDNFGGPREVDSEAHWIWANTGSQDGAACTGKSDCAHPDNEHACCRYTTTGSRRINCNAARMRYQEDYLQIAACHNTGGATAADGNYCNYDNQYAYTHFLQNGEAAGFIWHDELCNVDGTDVAVTLTDHEGSVAVVADNGYHLYLLHPIVQTFVDVLLTTAAIRLLAFSLILDGADTSTGKKSEVERTGTTPTCTPSMLRVIPRRSTRLMRAYLL